MFKIRQQVSGTSKRSEKLSYEATNLLKSSRETLFAIELVIKPSKMLEQPSGGQTIFCHCQKR